MATAGDRIDKFTLVRQLGAGGMGVTWEAVRQVGADFEQRVAIKLAEPEFLSTTDGLTSFRREAALAASLRHPNIAAVLDVDERAGYIVCELVDGADLRAVLRAVPGGRLEPSIVVYLAAQIARGLNHAHRRILRGRPSPVIHRDMSPGNVVVDYDGNIKIVDFGIAKALASGSDVAEAVKGKLSYMAPEQTMGGRMDGRVDQYALGVIAYEALSGVRPNDGVSDSETLANILEGRHRPLHERMPDVPAGLCRCVERMLALRPADRFANMEAVLDALSEFTPALTVHRTLAPLVVAARQPHTILRENGRFVCRPVEAEPLLRASWSGATGTLGGSTLSAARAPALAVTLGDTRTRPLDDESAFARAVVPPLPAARVLRSRRALPPQLPVRPDTVAPSQPPTAAAAASRSRWRLMAVLGAVLSVLVICVLSSPAALRSLTRRLTSGSGSVRWFLADSPAEHRPDARASVAADRLVRPAQIRLRLEPPQVTQAAPDSELPRGTAVPATAPNLDPQPSDPALQAHQVATVRVRVLPQGHVWVDETPYGIAQPELELSLAPGTHVIAAGTAQSHSERRTVWVAADRMSTVQFELGPSR